MHWDLLPVQLAWVTAVGTNRMAGFTSSRGFYKEHLFNCRRASAAFLFGSDFQRFMEGPGRAFGNEKN